MTTDADNLYEDETDFHSTPEVARGAEISESSARSLAGEIGVRRIGPAFAWSKSNYEELLTLVVDDDPDEAGESSCTDDDCACASHDGESDCEDDDCECVDHDEDDEEDAAE